MIFTTTIILLFSPANAREEKEWRIVIENSYKRDIEIWGTYGQVSEKTSLLKKKKSLVEKRNPVANMMLKNGKMVLIQPVSQKGFTTYKINQFSYKKAKGKRYNVDLSEGKNEFLEIYRNQLLAVLKKNKIDPIQVDWSTLEITDMACKSKRKKFDCKIPVLLKKIPNS